MKKASVPSPLRFWSWRSALQPSSCPALFARLSDGKAVHEGLAFVALEVLGAGVGVA